MIKFILIAALLIAVSGGVLFTTKKAPSPEQKIEQIKEQKNDALDQTGYLKCIEEVNESRAKREAGRKQCISDSLVQAGFSDNLDCVVTAISDPTNIICKDTTRYNAQVNADNKCNAEFAMKAEDLSEYDCQKLLK